MGNIYRDEYITTILKNINRLDNIYIYNMNKLRKYKDRNKENMDRITILTARLITAMEQNQDLVSKLRYLDTANKKIMQEIYNIQKQSLIVARDNYMLKHDIIKLDELNKILSKISYMTKQYVDSTNVLLYRLGRLTKSKLLYGNKNYKEYKSSGSSDYIIILQEKMIYRLLEFWARRLMNSYIKICARIKTTIICFSTVTNIIMIISIQ
ncbi:hypothetical protein [Turkeypox virus]|uniref:Uncharacterized protein n=1 Tax=Turkeypox virus TaxID=336486 RepID=A0A0M5HX47_9POXV|nr:hypothetical protein ASN15_gp114 [Turkeypox virus]ALA62488.1 hypothetical protein [Turkeypox virus]